MNITLMAHDKKKELMVQFCTAYKSVLAKHNLSATATTGRLVAEATGLPMTLFLSHNQGGHQQVDARKPGGVHRGQLALNRPEFHHTPVIVSVGETPTLDNILVAAHSRDADYRPLSSYSFRAIRFIHIEAVRTFVPESE